MGRSLYNHPDTAAAVAAYLGAHGVTRCPPRAAAAIDAAPPVTPRGSAGLPDPASLAVDGGKAGRRWYVAAVEPGADYRLHRELAAAGFLPWLVECRIRRRDAKQGGIMLSKPEPAFPGYLLLPLDLAREDWPAVEAVDGVDRLLRQAGAESPAPLCGLAIARLRAEIDQAGGVVIVEEGAPPRWQGLIEKAGKRAELFAKGQRVRVTAGPFTGFEGLYLASRPEDRIQILLDNVKLDPVVELPEAWAEPA